MLKFHENLVSDFYEIMQKLFRIKPIATIEVLYTVYDFCSDGKDHTKYWNTVELFNEFFSDKNLHYF